MLSKFCVRTCFVKLDPGEFHVNLEPYRLLDFVFVIWPPWWTHGNYGPFFKSQMHFFLAESKPDPKPKPHGKCTHKRSIKSLSTSNKINSFKIYIYLNFLTLLNTHVVLKLFLVKSTKFKLHYKWENLTFSRRRSEHTDRNVELKPTVLFRTTPTHKS